MTASVLAIALLASSTSVRAEVTDLDLDGFVSRNEAIAPVLPASVWDVLIEPSEWWNSARSFSGEADNLYMEARAGGCFCELLPPDERRQRAGSVRHMEVIVADPGNILRMVGALGPLQSEAVASTLTISLRREGTGTRVAFEYVVGGYMRATAVTLAPAIDDVLSQQLQRLIARLGGDPFGQAVPPLDDSATRRRSEPDSGPPPAPAPGFEMPAD